MYNNDLAVGMSGLQVARNRLAFQLLLLEASKPLNPKPNHRALNPKLKCPSHRGVPYAQSFNPNRAVVWGFSDLRM